MSEKRDLPKEALEAMFGKPNARMSYSIRAVNSQVIKERVFKIYPLCYSLPDFSKNLALAKEFCLGI